MEEYSISEVAKSCEIPASTLRYYEELGILKDVERDASGKRVYTRAQIDRLHAVECFKAAGMTMAEIRDFFRYEEEGDGSIEAMMALLRRREKLVEEQLGDMFMAYEHLLRKLDYYGAIEAYVQRGEQEERPCWGDYGGRDYRPEAAEGIARICGEKGIPLEKEILKKKN